MKKIIKEVLVLSFLIICFIGFFIAKSYIDYIDNKNPYLAGMIPPDNYTEQAYYQEYLDRMEEESYIPGYSWQDLADLSLDPNIGSDFDEDGLSDYDELAVYHSNPHSQTTAGDLYNDKYKVDHGMDVNKKYEGFAFDGNECSDWIDIELTTFNSVKNGSIKPISPGIEIPYLLDSVEFVLCSNSEITVDFSRFEDYGVVCFVDGDWGYSVINIEKYIKNDLLEYKIGSTAVLELYIVPEKQKGKLERALKFARCDQMDSVFYRALGEIITFLKSKTPDREPFDVSKNAFPFGNFSSEIALNGNCLGIAAVTSLSFLGQEIPEKQSFTTTMNKSELTYSYDISSISVNSCLKESNLYTYKNFEYSRILNNAKDDLSKLNKEDEEFVKLIGCYWNNYNYEFFQQKFKHLLNKKDEYYSIEKLNSIENYISEYPSGILVLFGESGLHAINVISVRESLFGEYRTLVCYDNNYPNQIVKIDLRISGETISKYIYHDPDFLSIFRPALYKNGKSIDVDKVNYDGFILLDSYGNIIA